MQNEQNELPEDFDEVLNLVINVGDKDASNEKITTPPDAPTTSTEPSSGDELLVEEDIVGDVTYEDMTPPTEPSAQNEQEQRREAWDAWKAHMTSEVITAQRQEMREALATELEYLFAQSDRIAVVRPNQRLAVDTFLGLKTSKPSFRTRVALDFQWPWTHPGVQMVSHCYFHKSF